MEVNVYGYRRLLSPCVNRKRQNDDQKPALSLFWRDRTKEMLKIGDLDVIHLWACLWDLISPQNIRISSVHDKMIFMKNHKRRYSLKACFSQNYNDLPGCHCVEKSPLNTSFPIAINSESHVYPSSACLDRCSGLFPVNSRRRAAQLSSSSSCRRAASCRAMLRRAADRPSVGSFSRLAEEKRGELQFTINDFG